MKLAFRKQAELDLQQIRDHIAKDSPQNAHSVLTRILSAIELNLMHYPYMGRTGLVDGTREWVVRGLPYVVIYKIDASRDILNIIGIFHTARHR